MGLTHQMSVHFARAHPDLRVVYTTVIIALSPLTVLRIHHSKVPSPVFCVLKILNVFFVFQNALA
jgi:hypothetical protein